LTRATRSLSDVKVTVPTKTNGEEAAWSRTEGGAAQEA
jgi:hypothetical protein